MAVSSSPISTPRLAPSYSLLAPASAVTPASCALCRGNDILGGRGDVATGLVPRCCRWGQPVARCLAFACASPRVSMVPESFRFFFSPHELGHCRCRAAKTTGMVPFRAYKKPMFYWTQYRLANSTKTNVSSKNLTIFGVHCPQAKGVIFSILYPILPYKQYTILMPCRKYLG